MSTTSLLSGSGLTGEQPHYGAIRTREVYDNTDTSIPIKKKCTWKHVLAILIIIVITGICLAVFLPGPLSALNSTPSIFGGMYSIAENQDYNVVNHYTKDLSCPDGYSAHIVGHFVACYQCGNVELHLCLKDNTKMDPRRFFGGMFNIDNCGSEQYDNPMTGSPGCDINGGYNPYLAIASQNDNNCDTNIYVCLKGELDYYNLGGFYTQFKTKIESESAQCENDITFECEDKNVEHHIMHSLQCPKLYEQHLIAHVYSPGSTQSCPGCNGRAYICLMPESESGKIDDKEEDDMLGAQHP